MPKELSKNQPQRKPEVRERGSGKFLDLFELSAEQIQDLKKKIEESHGLVRIFIHPDYMEYARSAKHIKLGTNLQSMSRAMDRVLSSYDEKNPPIVIFESRLGFGDGMKRWRLFDDKGISYTDQVEIWREMQAQGKESHSNELRQRQLANNAYIVPTAFANPMPLIDNMATEKDAWKKLNELFKDLGVKKVLIAGNELYTSEIENDHALDGCLGRTIEELKSNFEVELSTLTHPAGRKELRDKTIKINKQP